MDLQHQRELQLLEAVEQNQRLTQRGLATKLGVALGLTNLYLRRLVRKGYIKCVNVRSNRILYLITPQGLSEKARLTYEFMEYSLTMYRETRQHLRAAVASATNGGNQRVAICGTGEVAELAYLALKELGLEPVAIFSAEPRGVFLGMLVRDVRDHAEVDYDLMIVASLERRPRAIADLVQRGISEDRLITPRDS